MIISSVCYWCQDAYSQSNYNHHNKIAKQGLWALQCTYRGKNKMGNNIYRTCSAFNTLPCTLINGLVNPFRPSDVSALYLTRESQAQRGQVALVSY